MASDSEETRRRATTGGDKHTSGLSYPLQNRDASSPEPCQYKNAREYAQALRPWLWQYYTWTTLHNFLTFCPPCFPPNSCGPCPPGFAGDFRQHQQTTASQRSPQTQPNGHAPPVRRFEGVECTIPPFWKRVSAELIDFTILFYIKLVVTVVVMRELGFMEDILDYDFLENLDEIDYDRAFAITSEVIAMEIINRLLITVFETLCLRRGIGAIGGSTPGKRLLGLRVISCHDIQDLDNDRILVTPASDIGWLSAFIRSAIKNFTIAFFFPACLTIFMFSHNRAAYDVLSNTIVVETEEF
ncbi:hypothetical protein BaRGS_00023085 [Batillaria attramentaria]|uniref:RDD domain-containing protein n=1 Tax=Batillaria attramentaria TaxID=370345 RepID=A0ABD0KEP8_9CAEN